MDIIVIFKQRKERYPEQLAPEIHAACTQYEYEDGARDWMDKQETEAKAEEDIIAVRRVRLHMPDSFRTKVRKLLLEAPQIDCGIPVITEEK